MVIRLLSVLLCLAGILSAEVSITAEVNSQAAGESQPLEVFIVLSRPQNAKVDLESFRVGKEPVEAELVQESNQSSVSIINGRRSAKHELVSTFKLVVAGKPAGLHVLEPVTVVVDGKRYKSAPASYEIIASEKSDGFRLEAQVEGLFPLYPGQPFTVLYRIYFRDSIELTRRELPLLEADGLEKVGKLKQRIYSEQGFTVQELMQEVRGVSPTQLRFGPSMIEGFLYDTDFFGRKRYRRPRLKAEAEPVEIVIEPFPDVGRPKTFDGALGRFSWNVKLLTPSEMRVGDKIELEIIIAGEGEGERIRLPNFSGQPGFVNTFRFSDLPIVPEKVEGGTRFVLEMRPVVSNVTSIPPLELAYFDPYGQRYQVLRSAEIPITVQAVLLREPATEVSLIENPPDSETPEVGSIEIAGLLSLDEQEMEAVGALGRMRLNVLWLLPMGIALVVLQLLLRGYLLDARKRRVDSSQDLLHDAFRQQSNPELFFPLMRDALLTRLREEGYIPTELNTPALLPDQGITGEVRAFLLKVEELRFSQGQGFSLMELHEKTKELFYKIKA